MEQLDDKAEQMIKLGAALLAGGVALAGFAIKNLSQQVNIWFGVGTLGGLLLNLVAIGLFLRAYLGDGHHAELHVGPHPEWLSEKLDDPSWNWARHLGSLVRSFPAYSDENVARMQSSGTHRARGLVALVTAVLFFAIGTFLILAKVIDS